MKARSVLFRVAAVVAAIGMVLVAGAWLKGYQTQRDATSAVKAALDAHLAGQEKDNLSFLNEDIPDNGTFDVAQFSIDIATGYEVRPTKKWMNIYDVEIRTRNGRHYIASPAESYINWPNGERWFEWSIICCEQRD